MAFARRARDANDVVVAISNFTPVVRETYRLGVPRNATYVEILNSDDASYGGSGVRNLALPAEPVAAHDKAFSIVLRLPPLATVLLAPRR